jgi:hypothetical protein
MQAFVQHPGILLLPQQPQMNVREKLIMCLPKTTTTTTTTTKAKLTIAELITLHLYMLLSLPISFWFKKILQYIDLCGTGALGFTSYQCEDCGNILTKPNACNNRHCPKCGAGRRAEWAENVSKTLLPTEHFHLVFTLPHELNSCIQKNTEAVLNIFFQSITETLKQFAEKKITRS